ncbi:MAG: RNA-binding protein [Lachnospiraceae bacterium]|nr:RNA-binding protein [Lachnospiraceae bacterium]
MEKITVGQKQTLTVKRIAEFGAFLGFEQSTEVVLLPKKQVPEGTKDGDRITVFIYRDSEDRLIATVREPLVMAGGLAYLQVKAVTKIGAFLDWGLEKDLFLPYKEMEGSLKAQDGILVYVYTDKSGRLSATMKVYDRLKAAQPGEFVKDETFRGYVYRMNPDVGVFVAVEKDGAYYYGLIPKPQVFRTYRPGEAVEGRIIRVRADGKLDLSVREKAYRQIEADAAAVLKKIDEYDGELPFSDNASPEIIRRELNMSKNGFKKAIGHLYKEEIVEIGKNFVRRLK